MSEKRKKTSSDWHLCTWHPEMILVSKSPFTLQGFLIIPNSSSPAWSHFRPQSRIKLKLVAPNYPLIKNAQINFGTIIALLHNRTFNNEMKNLMSSDITVLSFLTQLQSLIGKHLCNKHDEAHINYLSLSNFMEDLKAVLLNSSDVQIFCDDRLTTIKLSLNDISLTLERNENTEVPWKIISSDLPKIPPFEGFEKDINKLNVAVVKFKWQVELLDKAWEQLKEIDENCWVTDPLEPNKSHMYRRIHLSQSMSVIIIINPLDPTALPEIKFSGSDSEVKRQTDYISNNISNWNPHCSILENLKVLLDIDNFPEQQESLEDNNAIVCIRDCGICFNAKSESDELPDKICNNKKCMKRYHSVCLSSWLQIDIENKVVFGHIHGPCLYCKEKISCSIK